MEWKQLNNHSTVLEVVMAKSGMTEEELLNPKAVRPEEIENLVNAASVIKKAVENNEHISIMGDYDADGITSSAILFCTLKKLGNTPQVRLPRRMSEGYGLSIQAVKEFPKGLLITVDNGIAAHSAIDFAKDNGLKVVVIDHHLMQETLPDADVIVDPHVNPGNNGFVEYCGAGLAYKLAQYMIDDEEFLEQMEALAAIGTIADSMPLIGDNRFIVKRGLKTMESKRNITPGLKALLQTADVYDIDETDIGFKIGPMLNAAGRMRDDGAMLSFETLVAPDKITGTALAEELLKLNNERKEVTTSTEKYVEDIIRDECMYYDKPMCIFAEGIPEGIVGIITGRIAEKYKTPTIILTDCEIPDVYKGSGRSYAGYNLMNLIR